MLALPAWRHTGAARGLGDVTPSHSRLRGHGSSQDAPVTPEPPFWTEQGVTLHSAVRVFPLPAQWEKPRRCTGPCVRDVHSRRDSARPWGLWAEASSWEHSSSPSLCDHISRATWTMLHDNNTQNEARSPLNRPSRAGRLYEASPGSSSLNSSTSSCMFFA